MLFYLSDVATWAGQLPGSPRKRPVEQGFPARTGRKQESMAVQAFSHNQLGRKDAPKPLSPRERGWGEGPVAKPAQNFEGSWLRPYPHPPFGHLLPRGEGTPVPVGSAGLNDARLRS
ncbi:hypothetical protein DZD52_05290 [Xanthomonas nasturtii]|uniref:Uncharacterized protein n=1 Tax=Xanthomonas nasturtii TaxID=1843581 RepID=A0A3E1KP24_9XANT|nr:hypothetical protein DZD52_05290 [Xanthomonas nasturtii]